MKKRPHKAPYWPPPAACKKILEDCIRESGVDKPYELPLFIRDALSLKEHYEARVQLLRDAVDLLRNQMLEAGLPIKTPMGKELFGDNTNRNAKSKLRGDS